MRYFIAAMLIISGCAFIFDLCFSLYLTFSQHIKQEKYPRFQRKFNTLLLLIPAMNEYSTLKRDMLGLLTLHDKCKDFIDLKLVFIDDASSDGTTELLDEWSQSNPENLYIIHRVKPNAQQGKGPALQDAINHLLKMNFPVKQTLVGIIDADSHFDSNYLHQVVNAFENSNYDLVQTRVDVYNTVDNLTIMQNFELSVYNGLLQMARTNWGSALASGNGQFVTLTMAEKVGWSSSLLEDCEFSLKGLLRGYYGTFLNTAAIRQEGITNLGKLIRQRTRWCQGGLQCLKIYGGKIIKSDRMSAGVKAFILLFLLLPYISVIVVPSSIVSVITLIAYARFNLGASLAIILTLLLTEYTINGLMIKKQWFETGFSTVNNPIEILRIIFSFGVYRWLLSFIPYRSIGRELIGNNSWTKTSHT